MKTTVEIPDPIFRQAKIRAAEEGRTFKEILVTALEDHLFGSAAKSSQSDLRVAVDESGWPQLSRDPDDQTIVTNKFVDELREELGV